MTSKTDSLRDQFNAVRERVTERVKKAAKQVFEPNPDTRSLIKEERYREEMQTLTEDPPVVARLMVEIRSDGSRTVARGAIKDELSGEQVALEAKGSTPLQLASQLAKSLLTTPLAAAQLRKAMLAARRERDDQDT